MNKLLILGALLVVVVVILAWWFSKPKWVVIVTYTDDTFVTYTGRTANGGDPIELKTDKPLKSITLDLSKYGTPTRPYGRILLYDMNLTRNATIAVVEHPTVQVMPGLPQSKYAFTVTSY